MLRPRFQFRSSTLLLGALVVALVAFQFHRRERRLRRMPPQPVAVTGTVTLDGVPLDGALIFFFPSSVVGSGINPAADVVDGRFTAIGVPGAYAVGVTEHNKYTNRLPSPIPERYANPATSGLTAEVAKSGPNVFRFELDTR